MGRWVGVAVAVLAVIALVIALGEDDQRTAEPPTPPPTLAPVPPASVPDEPETTTTISTPATTSTMVVAPHPAAEERALETPEDAERLLRREGIDPAKLSDEIAEYMERRFEGEAPRPR